MNRKIKDAATSPPTVAQIITPTLEPAYVLEVEGLMDGAAEGLMDG